MINKEFKGEVKIAIGEFELFDEEVKNKIQAAEKRIKDGINTELKEIINDEAVEKKLESLTKNVKDLQTKNRKLEAEIISVRHGVDN